MKNYLSSLLIMALSAICLGQGSINPTFQIQILNGQKQDILSESISNRRISIKPMDYHHQWQLKSSQIFKQRLDSTISETIEDAEEWMFEGKDIAIYDENYFCTELISYAYNGSSGFYLSSKMEFLSEDNINLTLINLYDWDKNKNEWEKDYKVEYEYYNNGLLKQYITFLWDESSESWINYQKSGSLYNEKGQLFIETYSEFDKETETWNDYMKTEFMFNSEWIKTGSTISVFDKDGKEWFELEKNEFSYNINGLLIQTIFYDPNFVTGEWEYDSKEENIFDSQNNLISSINSYWDDDNSTWLNSWKNDYVYNNAYTFDELLFPTFFMMSAPEGIESGHMNIESSFYEWDEDDETWIQLSKDKSYYSSLDATGISTNSSVEFKIFPNPTQDKFRVQSSVFKVEDATIEIYDLTGKKLIEKPFPAGTNNVEINVSHLKSGVYFCKVLMYGKIMTKKLIIQ